MHLHLRIPAHLASEPILHRLAADPGVEVVILRANLDEERGGWMTVRVGGEQRAVADAIIRLEDRGIEVERLEDVLPPLPDR